MADRLRPGVLVVHPDPQLRDEIVAALTGRGYSVDVVARRPARPPAPRPSDPTDPPPPELAATLVIADHTQLPVDVPGRLLVLVPTHEQGAILAAFAAGADDVLAGPLRPAELASRVAILARTAADSSRLTVGPITIDTVARSVTLGGQPLDLTRAEYGLLARLAASPGRVFTKHELLLAISAEQVARPSNPPPSRPHRRVDTQAARLRRRLGEHRGLLVTVWGVGYRLG